MNPETYFLEDDFKELDRLLSLNNLRPQDWDNIEALHTYLIRKIERLSYSKTPYEIGEWEEAIFEKYKQKKRGRKLYIEGVDRMYVNIENASLITNKSKRKINLFAKLIALLEPIAIFAFLSFQIWLNFQYTHSIERSLMYTGAWILGFYPIFFAILFDIKFENEKLNNAFYILLASFIPALNLFLSYPITHSARISLVHYCTWYFGLAFILFFVKNRKILHDNFDTITVNSYFLVLLIFFLLTLSLCFLAYYLRPI